MDEGGEREPEGTKKSTVVFEYVTEGDVCEVIGEFSLEDFLDELNEDDHPREDDELAIPDDASASALPSGIENNKRKDELQQEDFELKSREDLRDFVESTRNPNTVRKTNQVVRAFQGWLKNYCNEEREIETIAPAELDGFLSNYLLTKKKKKGGNHQPDTLTSIHRAILRHLKHKDYPVDPMIDDRFEMSREVLNSKRIKLKQEGLGNRPNKAESFDEDEINKMWDTGALGMSNPTILQHTLYWFLTIGFGLRGCDESRGMRWGDVALLQDTDEEEYLEWTERTSKTRHGGEGGHTRAFAPKIYSRKDDRCPVRVYKEFAAKRPSRSMNEEAPFYLTVRQGATMNDDAAYINAPMGVNKLREIVKVICEKAGIAGRHTNHSLRKTCCQTLMENDVPPVLVAQLSGHKNLASLNNYSVASRPQQRKMSNILTGKRPAEPTSQASWTIAKRNPCPSIEDDATSHGEIVLPPAPVAVSLPWAHPAYLPAPAANNKSEVMFQRMAEKASSMFNRAYVNGPVNVNFNYNVQANTNSQLNMSPRLPATDKSD